MEDFKRAHRTDTLTPEQLAAFETGWRYVASFEGFDPETGQYLEVCGPGTLVASPQKRHRGESSPSPVVGANRLLRCGSGTVGIQCSVLAGRPNRVAGTAQDVALRDFGSNLTNAVNAVLADVEALRAWVSVIELKAVRIPSVAASKAS